MTPPRAPVTSGLVAALATLGFAVGEDGPPVPAPDGSRPYLVVEQPAGGGTWGTLGAPDQCATWPYRVRAVGRTRRQAETVRDRAAAVVLGRSGAGFAVSIDAGDGFVVKDRRLSADGGVDRAGDVFNAVVDYVLSVVPA